MKKLLRKKIQKTHNLDYDVCQDAEIVAKVQGSRTYAQNLYAALCNNEWYERDIWQMLLNRRWSCSWRSAGDIVADIEDTGGNYLNWYCSGIIRGNPQDIKGEDPTEDYVPEGVITDEIREDLARLGWYPIED